MTNHLLQHIQHFMIISKHYDVSCNVTASSPYPPNGGGCTSQGGYEMQRPYVRRTVRSVEQAQRKPPGSKSSLTCALS
jgi:hypothetical protein